MADINPIESPDKESGSATTVWGEFGQLHKRKDIAFAFGIIAILAVLIVPLPKWMLDISLALSITFSILILMTVIFIDDPVDFNSFPTVLLVATMLRLALNLASTRLILSDGHQGTKAAGAVIESFGKFFMGNNFIIGIIVFAILVIVNFIVITKGSGRIAEVSARFTLDAMPGKQMAVDADLSAGLINESEAKERRKKLEAESSFFGAMDGAAKFVRGDAIAGLLITFINVIGGIIIGTVQKGLSFQEATHSYTLLTVGDGLVAQVPALIVSTGAGLLVSKGSTKGSADKAFTSQLGGYPRALGMSSFLMFALALIPNVPMFPFLLLSSITGAAAVYTYRQHQQIKQQKPVIKDEEAPTEEPISNALSIDHIRLELGYGLINLVNQNESSTNLTTQIKALRRQTAIDLGFIIPSIRLQDNLQLNPNEYIIFIKDIEAGKGEIRPEMFLAMNPTGGTVDLPGEPTTEPTFGLPATWIDESHKEEAIFKGFTVVDPSAVITTHLTEAIKDYMPELLSYSETQKLIDELENKHKKLVDDLIPNHATVGLIQRILQGLLKERVSIRDLPTILEGISEAVNITNKTQDIIEHVRARIGRQICENNSIDGVLSIIAFSPEWEQIFNNSIIESDGETQFAIPPSDLQRFIDSIKSTYQEFDNRGESPALLTNPNIRIFVRNIIERIRPLTTVMSQNEIHAKARIRTVGILQ
jgi:flagellar biosynthesis protein FlhA